MRKKRIVINIILVFMLLIGVSQTSLIVRATEIEQNNLAESYSVTFKTDFVDTENLYIVCRQDDKYYTIYLNKGDGFFSGIQNLPSGNYSLIKAENSDNTCELKQGLNFNVEYEPLEIQFEIIKNITKTDEETKEVSITDTNKNEITTDVDISSSNKDITVRETLKNTVADVFENSLGNVVVLLALIGIYGVYYYKNKPN